ncbi:hypothetical protein BU23DRAFT_557063 [Bimuria novae-zelandiae CBS 107.79]|uniref:Uncharacterized protein n=1 Tax=Bimuria novae-zelandiae CBS 107.79 TaxID=1447943 RepID=A0A6A5UYD3_9PLEO|nr:hypothetical protein BU23DRAFT_557063 [Bimuria novae-zelandiae CBS 107.79]
MFATQVFACKCHKYNDSVEWDASFDCCKLSAGFWILKDCKSPYSGFAQCCKMKHLTADC